MDLGRRPTPRPLAPPDSGGRRPTPDSEYPRPLTEAIRLTTPTGDYTLTSERVVVGRAPTCDVIIPDPLVSREHAILRIGPNEVLLEDLESANGVYVNNVRIFGRHQLCDGDRILVGTQELCVFAVASRRHPGPTRIGAITRNGRAADPVPSTERVDPGALLLRAAQRMLDEGAPRDAERLLQEHLAHTLEMARAGRPLSPSLCTDAARRALALATALRKSRWFDYAVELHYRAGLCMSTEVAGALAEAASTVSAVDRVLLGRYVTWLHDNAGTSPEEHEVLVRFLETIQWPGA
jgi:hypothetical protein